MPNRLTRREAEVLGCMVDGLTNKEIVGKLSISRSTLQHHVAHIYTKLGCSNRAQAIVCAIRYQLVQIT